MRKPWGKIGIYAGAVGLLAGGAGLSLAPAALASTGQPAAASTASHHTVRAAALHHVSPFGAAAHRSARPAARQHAAARSASPATGSVLWVSSSAAVGHNTSCASPGYATISAALAANPGGDTINVCSGTYDEQLVITSAVKLIAKGSVTVVGPASPASPTTCDADGGTQPNQDVVDICGPGTAMPVTITGFTIQGSWSPTVCYDSIYGVAVLGDAKLTMSRSTVGHVGGDPTQDGCQGGVGIEVGLATSGTTADTGTAKLSNDTVTSYQKNGITVDGAGSNATISNTTVTGAGLAAVLAQNGIQISDGATATISGSAVSGDECGDAAAGCGANPVTNTQSAGILAFDSGALSVTGTTVSASDMGVYNIEDYPWTYYTPPSPFVPVPVTFAHMGLTNRGENAAFDQGTSTITSSDLVGGEYGLFEFQYTGQAASAQVTATGDTFSHATANAIDVYSDKTAGDLPVQLTATGDNIAVSNAGGLENDSTTVANATGDWWGAITGPSGWNFGKGAAVTSDVNFFPWATNSSKTSLKTCSQGLTKSTTQNNVVLCAKPGTQHASLSNLGSGHVLLIANDGHDTLAGSSSGETWIIGSASGVDKINGNDGTGFIQERGNGADTLTGTTNYTVAAS